MIGRDFTKKNNIDHNKVISFITKYVIILLMCEVTCNIKFDYEFDVCSYNILLRKFEVKNLYDTTSEKKIQEKLICILLKS